MDTICLQCGDKGCEDALEYCVICRDFAVHRYCLDVIPKASDEDDSWLCDDCEDKSQNKILVTKDDGIPCKTKYSEGSVVETKKSNVVIVRTEERVDEGVLQRSYNACPQPPCDSDADTGTTEPRVVLDNESERSSKRKRTVGFYEATFEEQVQETGSIGPQNESEDIVLKKHNPARKKMSGKRDRTCLVPSNEAPQSLMPPVGHIPSPPPRPRPSSSPAAHTTHAPAAHTIHNSSGISSHQAAGSSSRAAPGVLGAGPSFGAAPRIKIFPRGLEFSNETQCARELGKIICKGFKGSWKSWKKIPMKVRDMWFRKFQKLYCWPEKYNVDMRKIFEHRGSNILKNKLYTVRKKNQRPKWIKKNVWNGLVEEWTKKDYQRISQVSKANRASNCGGQGYPLHRGGSISHLAHKDKLKEELGRAPKLAESFLRTHSTPDEQGEPQWVDERSKNTYTKFLDNLSSQGTTKGGEASQCVTQSEMQTWVETVGGGRKGTIYGLAGEAPLVRGRSSIGRSSTYGSTSQVPPEIYSRLDTLESELQRYRNVIDSLKYIFPSFDVNQIPDMHPSGLHPSAFTRPDPQPQFQPQQHQPQPQNQQSSQQSQLDNGVGDL